MRELSMNSSNSAFAASRKAETTADQSFVNGMCGGDLMTCINIAGMRTPRVRVVKQALCMHLGRWTVDQIAQRRHAWSGGITALPDLDLAHHRRAQHTRDAPEQQAHSAGVAPAHQPAV